MKIKCLFLAIWFLCLVGVMGLEAQSKPAYFGVPNKALGVPAEFGQAETAINQAGQSLGVRYCPDKLAQAMALAKEGVEAYWQCRTKEGLAMLDQAVLLATEAEVCACNPVYFDFDKDDLKPEAVAELNKAIKIMQENPSLKVELAGHTDSIGTEEYNINLGGERAVAVYDYFISKGLTDDRLLVRSYGEGTPVAANNTDEGRAKNRRVDIRPR